MADLSLTASAIVAASGANLKRGTAGATITAGQIVYLDASDSKYKLADADNLPAAGVTAVFMALNGASDNQPISVLQGGDVTMGSVLTAGTAYYLSPNPGGIAPLADVQSGDDVIVLGVAKSATVLLFKPIIPDVTLA